MANPVLEAAEQRRARNLARADDLIAKERRGDKVDEVELRRLLDTVEADDGDINALKADERRLGAAARANAELYGRRAGSGVSFSARPVVVTSEPTTYSADPTGPSFFRDLGRISRNEYGEDVEGARRRLFQHGHEVAVEARHNPELLDALEGSRFAADLEQRVNPNTTAGTGGEFVPPLWLVSQYVPYARPGRVIANRCTLQQLPPGIDTVNIPKLTTGSLEGIQIANAAPVASQDIQTSTVSAPVRTIAGQEDISMQLLEQSPLAMDA